MQEINLDPKIVLELIHKFPNNMELGKEIRSYYLRELDKKKELEKSQVNEN
jgi:hypothetical protein